MKSHKKLVGFIFSTYICNRSYFDPIELQLITNKTNTIMKKKFICAVCGYIYEGDAAPEKCPICKAPASKFSELKEDAEMTYATVHKIGDGKPEGVSQEMIEASGSIPATTW